MPFATISCAPLLRRSILPTLALCLACSSGTAPQRTTKTPGDETRAVVAYGVRNTDPTIAELSRSCMRSCRRRGGASSDPYLVCIKDCPGFESRPGRCSDNEGWLVCTERREGEEESATVAESTVAIVIALPFIVGGLVGLAWLESQAEDPDKQTYQPPPP